MSQYVTDVLKSWLLTGLFLAQIEQVKHTYQGPAVA